MNKFQFSRFFMKILSAMKHIFFNYYNKQSYRTCFVDVFILHTTTQESFPLSKFYKQVGDRSLIIVDNSLVILVLRILPFFCTEDTNT